ncbi:MAG: hypothetical protein ACRC20_02930 [Segniliparus sp.]|uniref:hypothetical protein n=1 Tax=Segniliparus sp. TaxID=2804064 RepID=UPI003F3ABA4A
MAPNRNPGVKVLLRTPWGEVYYDGTGEMVQLGDDRVIPKDLYIDFPGGEGQPSVFIWITVRNGVPICAEVTFKHKDDGPEVRTKDLRSIPLEHWIEEFVGLISRKQIGPGSFELDMDKDGAGTRAVRSARNMPYRTMNRETLQKVAEVYRDNFDTGPVRAVARTFIVSERTAARYVQLCRREGLLPPTTKGKKLK